MNPPVLINGKRKAFIGLTFTKVNVTFTKVNVTQSFLISRVPLVTPFGCISPKIPSYIHFSECYIHFSECCIFMQGLHFYATIK